VACFEYRSDLFEQSTIIRMVEHFTRLLTSLLNEPDQPVATLPLLSPQEQDLLLIGWNTTALDYPRQVLLPDRIREQAGRTPNALAAVCGDRRLSYSQLVSRASQLAMQLLALGVQAETLVGVYLQRSLDLLIAQLAVLLAGGAYVPLDPTLP